MFFGLDACPIQAANTIHFCATRGVDHQHCCARNGVTTTLAGTLMTAAVVVATSQFSSLDDHTELTMQKLL
uniref:DB domain-containing protein n=1 Tax=Ascaris lumbricoides TaxID=6252 RepID=A0A0M3HKU0_ASCLU